MIALLVSCADPADPLPDETSAEITTEPNAGEPIVTTEKPETPEAQDPTGSTAVTDAATTVPPTTETVRLPAYIPLEPTDTAELETVDTPVTLASTEVPWEITAWETATAVYVPEVSEKQRNLAIRVPTVYEGACEDLTVKVEFSQEYYPLGNLLQCKLTLTQHTDLPWSITIHNKPMYQMLEVTETEELPSVIGGISFGYFPKTTAAEYNYKGYKNIYVFETFASQAMDARCFMIYPSGEGAEYEKEPFIFADGTAELELPVNYQTETLTIESTPYLWVTIHANVEGRSKSDLYRMKIPLEIVEYESVSP